MKLLVDLSLPCTRNYQINGYLWISPYEPLSRTKLKNLQPRELYLRNPYNYLFHSYFTSYCVTIVTILRNFC